MENFQGLAVSQGRIGEDLGSYGFRIEGVRGEPLAGGAVVLEVGEYVNRNHPEWYAQP